jgi:hypothetical protein
MNTVELAQHSYGELPDSRESSLSAQIHNRSKKAVRRQILSMPAVVFACLLLQEPLVFAGAQRLFQQQQVW